MNESEREQAIAALKHELERIELQKTIVHTGLMEAQNELKFLMSHVQWINNTYCTGYPSRLLPCTAASSQA